MNRIPSAFQKAPALRGASRQNAVKRSFPSSYAREEPTPRLTPIAAALFFLVSSGAFADCTTGQDTINITADCTGDISAKELTVTAADSADTTVTGDVTGSGAFAENILTLKAAKTNEATKYYGKITGNVSNFGTINLDYVPPSSTINAGGAAAPLPVNIGSSSTTIGTGSDANAALKLNILTARDCTQGCVSVNKYFKLESGITGAGGLEVNLPTPGSAQNNTLILAGSNNTYTGLTTVRNGTLQIGDGANFSFNMSNNVVLEGASSLRFYLKSNDEVTYTGVISSASDASALIAFYIGPHTGTASAYTLTLTKDQTYIGGTSLAAGGILNIGEGGTSGNIGTGTLTIAANATVNLNRSDDLTWTASSGNVVSNAGTFNMKGGGNLTVDGAFIGAGTTNIEKGKLQLGNGENTNVAGAVSATGKFKIEDDTQLIIDYDIRTGLANMTHYNAGNFVILGAAGNNSSSNATTSGAGELIKNSSRTLILQGYIGHTGGTTVNEGTLQLGNNKVSATGTIGDIELKAGTTLRTGYTVTIPEGSAISGEGDLVANLSYNQANGANYCASGTACTTTLNGTLSYTGSTEVVLGTLKIGGSASLDNTSALILRNGTTFLDNTTNKTQNNLDRLVVDGRAVYGDTSGSSGKLHADTLDFYIPAGTDSSSTALLTVRNTELSLAGSTINVVLAGSSPALGMGSEINIIGVSNNGALSGSPANTTSLGYAPPDASGVEGTQGALIAYAFDLIPDVNTLKARVSGARIREEAKSLSEGHLSGSAALVRSGDFIATQGITAARGQLARNYGADDDGKEIPENGLWGSGLQPFFAHGGGRVKHITGSHVDTRGYNFLFGVVGGRRAAAGEVMAGAFFEYGKGEYDTYNSFTAGEVVGDGNTHHRGGGIFGRIGMDSGLYLEASLRRGRIDVKYQSDYLRDAFGTRAAYTSKTDYSGAHLGLGKVWSLSASEKWSLDTYGQALWTRQNADTVELSTGERVSFDRVTSERLKAGARLRYDFSRQSAVYVGASYDREFAGKAKAKLTDFGGAEIPVPKMTGGTGVVELGFLLTPTRAQSPLSVDFGVQGYTGKREGVTGSLRLNYYF